MPKVSFKDLLDEVGEVIEGTKEGSTFDPKTELKLFLVRSESVSEEVATALCEIILEGNSRFVKGYDKTRIDTIAATWLAGKNDTLKKTVVDAKSKRDLSRSDQNGAVDKASVIITINLSRSSGGLSDNELHHYMSSKAGLENIAADTLSNCVEELYRRFLDSMQSDEAYWAFLSTLKQEIDAKFALMVEDFTYFVYDPGIIPRLLQLCHSRFNSTTGLNENGDYLASLFLDALAEKGLTKAVRDAAAAAKKT